MHQFTKAKIKTQYLASTAHFSAGIQDLITSNQFPVDTAAVVQITEGVCDHFHSQFPEHELKE